MGAAMSIPKWKARELPDFADGNLRASSVVVARKWDVRTSGQVEMDKLQDGLVLGNEDLGQGAGRRGGDLGVDLVGGDLEQRLVDCDVVADGLQPLGDGAFGDAFTECREGYVSRHVGRAPLVSFADGSTLTLVT